MKTNKMKMLSKDSLLSLKGGVKETFPAICWKYVNNEPVELGEIETSSCYGGVALAECLASYPETDYCTCLP